MVKLLDSLLHRPSQKYGDENPSKNYYSAKHDILARALEAERSATSTANRAVPSRPTTSAVTLDQVDSEYSDNDSDTVFYTPRSSMASSATSLSSSTADSDTTSLFSVSPTSATTDMTSHNGTYTDQDWKAELRQRPLSRSAPSSRSSSPSRSEKRHHRPPPPPRPHKKVNRSIMMSMTALLEMDDDDDATNVPSGGGKGYVSYAPAHSNVILTSTTTTRRKAARNSFLDSGSRYPDFSSTTSSSDHSHQPKQHAPVRSSPLRPVSPERRRSKSLGDQLSETSSSSAHPYTSTNPSQLPSNGTAGYTSLTLPRAPMPSALSSNKVKVKLSSNGKIDLTTSGVAQTTMATVEVVAGLSSATSTKSGKRKHWRIFSSGNKAPASTLLRGDASPLGFTSHRSPPSSVPSSHVLVQVWAVGVDSTDGRLAGLRLDNAGTIIPTALDDEDQPPEQPNVGFIPGRSFVGRILECGFDPNDYEDSGLKKGEWVIGLCDPRKSGCLAEFITVDRHRLCRVPQPLLPSLSGPQPRQASTQGYTLEQLALIPLIGIPAYRAVRSLSLTFETDSGLASTSSSSQPPTASSDAPPSSFGLSRRLSLKSRRPPTSISLPPPIPQQRKVLILRGNSPLGLLLIQMLVKRKWICVAHVSMPLHLSRQDGDEDVKLWMKGVEEKVRKAGGVEVVFDDGDPEADPRSSVDDDSMTDRGSIRTRNGGNGMKTPLKRGERQPLLRVVQRLREEGDVFDVVIDTVGGKDVWRECSILLASSPQSESAIVEEEDDISVRHPRSQSEDQYGRRRSEEPKRKGSLSLGRSPSTFSSRSRPTRTPSVTSVFTTRSSSLHPPPSSHDGVAQFITLVGDYPLRPIPTAKQHFKAGLRSLNPNSSSTANSLNAPVLSKKVNYAWISSTHDLSFEGEDVKGSLEACLRESPWIWVPGLDKTTRGTIQGVGVEAVVGFEQAPEKLFREGSSVLKDGGVGVVRVVP